MKDTSENSQIAGYASQLLDLGIQHEQWVIRFAAAEALADLQDEKGLDILRDALKNESAFLRDRAIMALGKLKNKSLEDCFIGVLKDKDQMVRGHAIEALAMVSEKACLEKIPRCLKDNNHFVQECAVVALCMLPGESSHPVLESVIFNRDGYNCVYLVKLSAAYYLAKDGNEQGKKFLHEILKSQDAWLAFLAAKNLAMLGDKEGIPQIRNMLSQGGWKEKVAALEAMLNLGIIENVVEEIYKPSETIDEMTKLEIIRLLDRFAPDKTSEALKHALESKDENIRIRALEVIGELKKPELVSLAQDIINKGPEHLRGHILMAIEKIGEPLLISSLLPMLEKSHFLIRLQTARVILKLARIS